MKDLGRHGGRHFPKHCEPIPFTHGIFAVMSCMCVILTVNDGNLLYMESGMRYSYSRSLSFSTWFPVVSRNISFESDPNIDGF